MSKLLYYLTGSKCSKTLPAIVEDYVWEDIVTYIERCQSVVAELREFRIMGNEQQTSLYHAPQLLRVPAEKERGQIVEGNDLIAIACNGPFIKVLRLVPLAPLR